MIFSRLVTLFYPCPSKMFCFHQEFMNIMNAPDLFNYSSKLCLPSNPQKIFGWWMNYKITICHKLFLIFPFIDISTFIKNHSKKRFIKFSFAFWTTSTSFILFQSSVDECIIRLLFATIFDDLANTWDDLQTYTLNDIKFRHNTIYKTNYRLSVGFYSIISILFLNVNQKECSNFNQHRHND